MTPLFLAALLAAPVGPDDAAVIFPTVTSSDLNGRRVTLPADLPGRRRLVLIGYDRDDQEALDVWIASAVALKIPEADLGIAEVPIVDDPGAVGRTMIEAGMKLAVRDRATRARVVTLYTDKAKMMRLLGLRDDTTVDLLLLGSGGEILWRESGPATPQKMTSLLKAAKS